jgi:hypothetical protein
VSGPASSPAPASSLRSPVIRPAAAGLMARGEDLGRRDRGSNAAWPSARYRATSRDTHPCETP